MNLKKVFDAEMEANFDKVTQLLAAFKRNYDAGDPDTAAGRLYYACYHAVKARLLAHGQDPRTHQGVRSELDKFLKEQNLDIELGKNFSRLETLRNMADYNIHKQVDGKTMEDMVKPAYDLIELMKKGSGKLIKQ
jgi:uncharacterized protein (UPF0332 family)